MNRTLSRPGVTLIEVMVAIFVMAIGLMALLTLFPLGALNMAQAIKDDRTGNAAQNAAATARVAWREIVAAAGGAEPDQSLLEAMSGADMQTDGTTPADWAALDDRTDPLRPGYPVLIDPIGYRAYTGAYKRWVAGVSGGLPRYCLRFYETAPTARPLPASMTIDSLIHSHFTMRDDVVFDNQGRAGTSVEYEGKYSWAYLVRRTQLGTNDSMDLSIVVFSGRALSLDADSLLPRGERSYTASFQQGSRSVTLTWNTGTQPVTPPVRRGGWILDATMKPPGAASKPNGYFYRIENYGDPVSLGNNNFRMVVDLRTEARATSGAAGTAVVMPDVVEVFSQSSLFP